MWICEGQRGARLFSGRPVFTAFAPDSHMGLTFFGKTPGFLTFLRRQAITGEYFS